MNNLLILFYTFLIFNTQHPVHLSVTNIEYLENSKNFEVKIRFFADDFENSINKKYNIKINLNTKNELKTTDNYLSKYCKENLNIIFDGKTDTAKKMILKSRQSNSKENTITLNFYFKAEIPKKVKITNKLMTDFFQDQKNLLIFTCKNTQEALKFDNSFTTKEIPISN